MVFVIKISCPNLNGNEDAIQQCERSLPESVRHVLPAHAQEIYLESFNSAYKQYKTKSKRNNPTDTPEKVARKVAWAAVKKKYKKGTDKKWHSIS